MMEKNKHDPLFQGTLNQLELFRQLRQHLACELIRYRNEGRIDIVDLITYYMADE
jgi:hypothetical protein